MASNITTALAKLDCTLKYQTVIISISLKKMSFQSFQLNAQVNDTFDLIFR